MFLSQMGDLHVYIKIELSWAMPGTSASLSLSWKKPKHTDFESKIKEKEGP
jgi:hypothetical protein